jgi:transposase
MRSIKDFKYTSRADMSTDIRDTLEIVQYIQTLEQRVIDLEAKLRGKEFMQRLKLKDK